MKEQKSAHTQNEGSIPFTRSLDNEGLTEQADHERTKSPQQTGVLTPAEWIERAGAERGEISPFPESARPSQATAKFIEFLVAKARPVVPGRGLCVADETDLEDAGRGLLFSQREHGRFYVRAAAGVTFPKGVTA